jgi:hypothetical protein
MPAPSSVQLQALSMSPIVSGNGFRQKGLVYKHTAWAPLSMRAMKSYSVPSRSVLDEG